MFSTLLIVGCYLLFVYLVSKVRVRGEDAENTKYGLISIVSIVYWLSVYYLVIQRPQFETYDQWYRSFLVVIQLIAFFGGVVLLWRLWGKADLKESEKAEEQIERKHLEFKVEMEKMRRLESEEDSKWLLEIVMKYNLHSENDMKLVESAKSRIREYDKMKWFFALQIAGCGKLENALEYAKNNESKQSYKQSLEKHLAARQSTGKDTTTQ